MKQYPTIQGPSKAPQAPCIAFYKYDGSNLRWEWSHKRGWHKYGTRNRLFDETDPMYGQAIPIFMEKLAPQIDPIIQKKHRNVDRVVVFTEFFGPSSFSGQHKEDEPKELKLFDVNIHKKGLLSPRDFVKQFGHLDFAAQVVYEGNLNNSFIQAVRNSEYPVVEGVVCKGGSGHKLWMVKIKTNEYRERLKQMYEDRWKDFWE